ncbi:MAG: hypothetical protein DRI34_11760 [Deltaproteobacteria bacterium]|nr:MAG: hypothetical protein DRI34_11760 [Deltaproteobacteria bacterium]
MQMNESDRRAAARLRWQPGQRPFYEVFFIKANLPGRQQAFWLRYTLSAPRRGRGAGVAQLWGIFFDGREPGRNFAVQQTLPIAELQWLEEEGRLLVGSSACSPAACSGSIDDAGRGHRLAWNFTLADDTPPLWHFSHRFLYRLTLPKTKLACPVWNGRLRGWLEVDGERLELDGIPGQLEHLWGTEHALRWAWGHCNAFVDEADVVWEGLDAQVALGPVPSPHLKVFYLQVGQQRHRFDKLSQWLRNRSHWEPFQWEFAARGPGARLRGRASCHPDDVVVVTYTDPGGARLYCHNSKLADLELQLEDNAGNPLGTFTARRTAALEFVDRRLHGGLQPRL